MSVLASQTAEFPRPNEVATSFGSRLFPLRRSTSLTIALLVVSAIAAAYGIFTVVRQEPLWQQLVAWSACVLLVCLASLILLISRYTMQRSLNHVEQQLKMLLREDRLDHLETPVPDHLQKVMGALSEYVAHVRNRVDRLQLQKKELDIQMRATDAERRHTEAIIFSISDAVLVIDSYGELAMANNAAERIFSFQLSEWRRRPIERVLEDSTLINLIKDARASGGRGARRQVEYSLIRDSKTQTFNITLSTVVDAEGQARGVVAVFHDITREREIAQIKTDFVSAVSHELRTPLSSIKAYVEMLMDGEAHDEKVRREFYQIIESETDRLQRLISNILNISRIESGVMEVHRQLIKPNEVIKEVLDVMAPQANEKKVSLEQEPAEALPNIWADRDLLYQAILNLVSNAIKYTPEEGQIRVDASVDSENSHLAIAVIDNGMGIPAKDLPRIFDKFYRAKRSATVAKGTGLGLNLVKHIVETVHQGEISVTSEQGAGTTIVLRFPLRGD